MATYEGALSLLFSHTADIGIREGAFSCNGVSAVAVTPTPTQAVWEGSLSCGGISAVAVVGGKIVTTAVTTTGLAAEYVAKLANYGTVPGTNAGGTPPSPTTMWNNLMGGYNATLANSGGNFGWTTSSGWAGSGSESDPYCLVGDGTGDIATIPASSVVNPAAPFSIEVWYYKASNPASNAYVCGNHASNKGWGLYIDPGGNAIWQLGTGTGYTNASSPGATGAWKHAVITYDGTTCRTYGNGSAGGTGATAWSANTGVAVSLFRSSASQMFAGKIASVRFYSVCLTSAQVAYNYGAGVTAASTDADATRKEGSFTCGAVSSVAVAATPTSAVWEGSFSCAAISAVASVGIKTPATVFKGSLLLLFSRASHAVEVGIREGVFSCDGVSAVAVTPTPAQAIWEASFSCGGISAVAVVGAKIASNIWAASFTCGAVSSVAVAGIKTSRATWEGSLTVGGASTVTVIATPAQAIWEGAFSCDAVSAVFVYLQRHTKKIKSRGIINISTTI